MLGQGTPSWDSLGLGWHINHRQWVRRPRLGLAPFLAHES
jgi:hypothetical protein